MALIVADVQKSVSASTRLQVGGAILGSLFPYLVRLATPLTNRDRNWDRKMVLCPVWLNTSTPCGGAV